MSFSIGDYVKLRVGRGYSYGTVVNVNGDHVSARIETTGLVMHRGVGSVQHATRPAESEVAPVAESVKVEDRPKKAGRPRKAKAAPASTTEEC
jgi:hypothetical protein